MVQLGRRDRQGAEVPPDSHPQIFGFAFMPGLTSVFSTDGGLQFQSSSVRSWPSGQTPRMQSKNPSSWTSKLR